MVVGAGLLGNLTGAAPAPSQDVDRYPNRPVKLVVPIAAGGSADKLARTVAQKLSEKWGQSLSLIHISRVSHWRCSRRPSSGLAACSSCAMPSTVTYSVAR